MKIPESYETGVRHIEDLNFEALQAWLEAELHEKLHILSGQADDFPVQAIVNHYLYLSPAAQKRLSEAVDALILEWRGSPTDWPDSAARALLDLAAELRVTEAKSKLQVLVESGGLSGVEPSLRPVVFRTIATLSTNNDRKFWYQVPQLQPEYAGMAFQILARIAPKVALLLLGQLPVHPAVIDGVARKLPEFIAIMKPRKLIPKVSKRQSERLREYAKVKREWWKIQVELFGIPMCQVPGCDRAASHNPSHRYGRVGSLLCESRLFDRLCPEHYNWPELHPQEARQCGLLCPFGQFNTNPFKP